MLKYLYVVDVYQHHIKTARSEDNWIIWKLCLKKEISSLVVLKYNQSRAGNSRAILKYEIALYCKKNWIVKERRNLSFKYFQNAIFFLFVIFVHVLWNNQWNTDKQTRKSISSYPTILAFWFNSMSTLSVFLRSIFYILPVSVVKKLSWESRRGQTNFEIIKINVSIRLVTMKKDSHFASSSIPGESYF